MAIKFPFFNMQEFNLDWLMVQFKKMLQFMPIDSGNIGDVLQRKADGAAWEAFPAVVLDIDGLTAEPSPDGADELPIYDVSAQANRKITIADLQTSAPVTSVNGQTGAVVLTIPSDTSDLTNTAGFVDAAGAAAAAPVQSVNGQTGNVIVSDGAVTSVNGQTGDVILSIPTDTSDLVNDSGFVDAAGAAAAAPVQSVNGQTGAVVISASGESTLLWTNAHELLSFSGQTIIQDLSSYSFVLIEYAADQYVATILTALFPVPTHTPPTGYTSNNYLQGFDLYTYKGVDRQVQISSSGIVFGDGHRIDTYAGSGTVDNTLCRPLRIWGIV